MFKIKSVIRLFVIIILGLFISATNLYAKDVCRMVSGTWSETDNPIKIAGNALSDTSVTIKDGKPVKTN